MGFVRWTPAYRLPGRPAAVNRFADFSPGVPLPGVTRYRSVSLSGLTPNPWNAPPLEKLRVVKGYEQAQLNYRCYP